MKIAWMRKIVFLTMAVTLLCCGIAQASLTYTTIPFTYNSNNFGRDINYPTGTGDIFGIGIPFNIPSYNPSVTVYNTWDSNTGYSGSGTQTLTIPINIAGVQKVFTLINTSWGVYASQYTTLDFDWSGGLTVHKVLVGGADIRDWWQGAYTNTISSPTVNVYTDPIASRNPRVDMQEFDFTDPQYAGKTLLDIIITDTGDREVQRAYLYGVTVGASPVPLPPTVLLLGSGLVGLGVFRKKFNKG